LEIDTHEDASLAPLRSLPELTSLRIGPVNPAAIRSDLAALSQLEELTVAVAAPDADASGAWHKHLVPLTALRDLTYFCGWLHVDRDDSDEEEVEHEQEFEVFDVVSCV
jgi:hypothetical protein